MAAYKSFKEYDNDALLTIDSFVYRAFLKIPGDFTLGTIELIYRVKCMIALEFP